MLAKVRAPLCGLLMLLSYLSAAVGQAAESTPVIQSIPSSIPRPAIPPGDWKEELPAEGHEEVTFRLALKGENFHLLEKKMNEIAEKRREWLTTEGLKYYVAASNDAKARVESFLVGHGVSSDNFEYDNLQGSLNVKTNAATASKMFKSELSRYKHKRTAEIAIKARGLEVPSELQDIIINVNGLTSAPQVSSKAPRLTRLSLDEVKESRAQVKRQKKPVPCGDHSLTYECIAKKYGYQGYKPAPNSEHVAALLYGQYRDSAIEKFIAAFTPHVAKGYQPNKAIFGKDQTRWTGLTGDDGEGTMDTEILIGTAYPLNITAYATTMESIGNIKELIALPDNERPGVVTLSWGGQEEAYSKQDAIDYCNQVQQLTALGTTFVTATGDHGVSISLLKRCPPFRADFQSSCPYVLAVGATAGWKHERAAFTEADPDVYNGWSSGGFSNHLPMPEYQRKKVEKYLQLTNNQYSQYFNPKGRAFPDIAAYGNYVNAADTRDYYFASGTSAASPLVAGLLALVNAKCKEKGKGRIGWVHPALYSKKGVTRDITVGGSYMCEPDEANRAFGFPCHKGWDPATGMGSPRFQGFLKAFGCD